MKKIILTGGGTGGHVMPSLALVPGLIKRGYEIYYIGGKDGIEKDIVGRHGLMYYGISAGKLRRYADIKNITDIFRVIKGFFEALCLIRRIRPVLVFSKGGFVTVPVVAASRLLGVRTVIHESDITPGLANRLAAPFAHTICASFPETLAYIPKNKAVLTGIPVRNELLCGDASAGAAYCGFEKNGKPVVLVTGGSLGAAAINGCVRQALPELVKRYQVAHLTGKGNLSGIDIKGYKEIEFAGDEMAHLYALADLAVSRAGATTLFELLALKKPHLLIPLGLKASRGDQLKNAASFEARGLSMVLQEEVLTPERLVEALDMLFVNRDKYIHTMTSHGVTDGVSGVMGVLDR